MNVGGIEQIGTPDEIYNRPRSRFVADFVGSANLIVGRVAGTGAPAGAIRFETAGGLVLQATAPHRPRGDETTVAVRTAYIELFAGAPDGRTNAVAANIRRRMFTAISSSTSSTGRMGS